MRLNAGRHAKVPVTHIEDGTYQDCLRFAANGINPYGCRSMKTADGRGINSEHPLCSFSPPLLGRDVKTVQGKKYSLMTDRGKKG